MLLGGKSLKIIDLLEIELMSICHLKVILLISDCTFMILAQSAQKLKRPPVILPFKDLCQNSEVFKTSKIGLVTAMALPEFNDLGRLVILIFLSKIRFYTKN